MKNRFILAIIPIVALIGSAFYATSLFITPSPKKEITIATGSKNGQYYQTALKYKEILKKEDVKVNIINTNGSIENIELLKSKKADVAFVQNGILKQKTHLQTIAAIYYEPLWLFYNSKQKVNYVKELKNKTISIGQIGSGTKSLSEQIIKLNGINKNNTNLLYLSSKESYDKIKKDEIDAAFFAVSQESKLIRELLEDEDIKVLSFSRARAYSKKLNFLHALTIYEGSINLKKNIPNRDFNLISTTATLVINDNLPDELIRLLLKKVKDTHSSKTLFANEDEFPNLKGITTKINDEASRYFKHGDTWLEEIFPYWIASTIDRLKILLIPLLTLFIPFAKGVFPLYKWSIRSKIYRWYGQIQELDLKLEHDKSSCDNIIKELEILKKEIKNETKVPLSYMGEYYDLIMHLELIITKANLKKDNQ
ncbi:MAG: TAXI family TRAP transporter solute-binding subunit [Campylobacterota bacterium]